MRKIKYETKIEVVRLYFEEHIGSTTIAKQLNIGSTSVERIINLYKRHGEAALRKKQQTKSSKTTKIEIINRMLNGKSRSSLAYEYNISHATINYWLNNYEKNNNNGLRDKPRGRPPMKKTLTIDNTSIENK